MPLLVVSLGVVMGFPLLTALALQPVTAAHSTVFIAMLRAALILGETISGAMIATSVLVIFRVIGGRRAV